MERVFNEEENREIYDACNTLRASMTVSMAVYVVNNPGTKIGMLGMIEKIEQGSVINDLVKGYDWDKLFQNEEWLNVLQGATNLNFLENGQYKEYLMTIAKFFPEETKGYIILEIL